MSAPAEYTQKKRPMRVTPPSPYTTAMLLESFRGAEGLSELFHYKLDLLVKKGTTIEFDKILGQKVTVTFDLPNNKTCNFSGIVSRFSQGQEVPGEMAGVTFIRYRAELRPKFWLLTHKVQSRIFQQVTVPDILKKVLTGLEVTYEINGTYQARDYCAQYRESDFQFASRLMEEEGIYYFFKHTATGHKMVLADTADSHPNVPGTTPVNYEEVSGVAKKEERIFSWEKAQEIRSGKYTLWDHCFEMPEKNLEANQAVLETVQIGKDSHKLKVAGNDQYEVYDYPGAYAQRFDGIAPGGGDRASDLQHIFEDNKRTVKIRMQQETTPAVVVTGQSNCRYFVAGHKFTLQNHFNGDGSYVLTRVEHEAGMEGAYTTNQKAGLVYRNKFECIPFALPFRPRRVTPKARVEGTQTAVVVGSSGEEIFTDKYGRVKVQFNWDRQGSKDADSSCWVRVGTPWAGKNWGAIHIPRIGQEVIVAFLEGDPDQPIIVGSVYNATQMPPYTLPDNKTQSGLKTRSSLQGTTDNFNELRFEDKKDSEDIFFHAEKDFHREVENDDDLKVGHDQTIEVKNNRTETVKEGDEAVTIAKGNRTHKVKTDDSLTVEGKNTITVTGDRTETVKQGNESVTISTGNRTVSVDTGNDTHQVKKGNREVQIDMGNDTLTIKMGNQTTNINMGKSETTAMQSIELKVGENSVKIDQSGVTIQGLTIKLQGQVQVQMQAPMTQVNGDGMLQLKGGIIMANS